MVSHLCYFVADSVLVLLLVEILALAGHYCF